MDRRRRKGEREREWMGRKTLGDKDKKRISLELRAKTKSYVLHSVGVRTRHRSHLSQCHSSKKRGAREGPGRSQASTLPCRTLSSSTPARLQVIRPVPPPVAPET
jgi:hypothetical protein